VVATSVIWVIRRRRDCLLASLAALRHLDPMLHLDSQGLP